MQRFASVASLALAGILVSGAAGFAEESAPTVVTVADMEQAIARAEGRDVVNRAAIRRLLERPEVRDLAHGAGVDGARAAAAIAVLDDTEAARLAELAIEADAALAGGQGRMSGGTGGHFPLLYAILIIAILAVLIVALVA